MWIIQLIAVIVILLVLGMFRMVYKIETEPEPEPIVEEPEVEERLDTYA